VTEKKSDAPTSPTVKVVPNEPNRRGPSRLRDNKGDVGFRGGARPDERDGKPSRDEAGREPARPRDTGRQGS
jgi:hypothetical protein